MEWINFIEAPYVFCGAILAPTVGDSADSGL